MTTIDTLTADPDEFFESVQSEARFRPTIGCVIPAYNEAD